MAKLPLSAALLLLAASVQASPSIPSFEFSAAQLQASVAALRAAQAKTKAGDIGPQLSSMAWDFERWERDSSRLQNDLRWLLARVRRYQKPQSGKPDMDPSLKWDLQSLTRDLAQLSRDSQWRLNDLRFLSSQAQKDDALIAPAQRLSDDARNLKSATGWLSSDARFAYFDLIRAGFTFEGMDLDRDTRDLDQRAQDLQGESERLLAKVRGA